MRRTGSGRVVQIGLAVFWTFPFPATTLRGESAMIYRTRTFSPSATILVATWISCSCAGPSAAEDAPPPVSSQGASLFASAATSEVPPPPELPEREHSSTVATETTPPATQPEGPQIDAGQDAAHDGAAEEAGMAEGTEHAESPLPYPMEAVAYQFVTQVSASPSPDAPVVGYLRRGSRVRISPRVIGRGCRRGWHEVEGGGYLCDGGGVVAGERPAPWPDSPPSARLDQPLPYRYFTLGRDQVPEFWEQPTAEQEQALSRAIEQMQAGPSEPAAPPALELTNSQTQPVPTEGQALADGTGGDQSKEEHAAEARDEAPEEEEKQRLPSPARRLLARGFVVSTGEGDGRWLRTIRGRYLKRSMATERESSNFRGVELGTIRALPLAFVTRGRAKALRFADAQGLRFEVAGTLRRQSVLPVLGQVNRDATRYVAIGRGLLARENVVTLVEAIARPYHIKENEKWVDVDLSQQTLVAYEGDRPVYATLVSTGRSDDGFPTPVGAYRIRAKHVSATMDDPDAGEEAYSIEDVPWTMYFHESYALHGAFWHDRFGRERSHGCINLSPADARWLFFWTTPDLPPGWHGVRASESRQGTHIVIRP
jgi:hypothetical protein